MWVHTYLVFMTFFLVLKAWVFSSLHPTGSSDLPLRIILASNGIEIQVLKLFSNLLLTRLNETPFSIGLLTMRFVLHEFCYHDLLLTRCSGKVSSCKHRVISQQEKTAHNAHFASFNETGCKWFGGLPPVYFKSQAGLALRDDPGNTSEPNLASTSLNLWSSSNDTKKYPPHLMYVNVTWKVSETEKKEDLTVEDWIGFLIELHAENERY